MSKSSASKPAIKSNTVAAAKRDASTNRKHMWLGFGVMGAAAAALGSAAYATYNAVTEVV
jgi:hypothetical protein